MAVRKALVGLVLCVVIVAAFVAVTGRALHAQGGGESSVLAKLEEVLSGQKAIMDELAAMKEELRIIKIRVTQQQ